MIPPLPNGTVLVQVQILIRHGSRTQWSTRQCWNGGLPEYNCSATLLEGPIAPPTTVLPKGSVLFRKEYTRGRNQLPGNCALGQLVHDGIEMQRRSGRHLRAAYSSILPANPAGHESTFFLRSDDSPRTIASGQALFSAMFPLLDQAVVVPWHVMDESGEETITCKSTTVCPALASAVSSAQAARRQDPHYRAVTLPLAAELSAALNRTVTPSDFDQLLDCMMSVHCPTVPSKGGAPPAALTPALQRRAMVEIAHSDYSIWNDSTVARLGAGPLIGEITTMMERAQRRPDTPSFVLFSGHDTGPMGPVLGALHMGGAEFPRFADLISIELHRVGVRNRWGGMAVGGPADSYAVRAVHNGDIVTPRIPGCPAAELCPYSAFHAATAALVPTPPECGRDDSPDWWPRPALSSAL